MDIALAENENTISLDNIKDAKIGVVTLNVTNARITCTR